MSTQPIRHAAAAISTSLLIAGCSSFSHTNRQAEHLVAPAADAALRTTLAVTGDRGNKRVLMFLTLSGGGSRAAVWSTEAMLRLQTMFDDADLLAEVDVMSSVSGGSMAAAYYAATRDTELRDLALARSLHRLATAVPEAPPTLWAGSGPAAPLAGLRADPVSGRITCPAPLEPSDRLALSQAALPSDGLPRLEALCAQAAIPYLPTWQPAQARRAMQRNYLARWFGNWFLPNHIVAYWLTPFDRADIMAKTLGDSLYDMPLLGRELALGDLNPTRPYLIINATQASGQQSEDADEDYPFGSVFTFTEQDFRDRLNSGLAPYSVARAVMASSAFPLVFANTTLRDFRSHSQPHCEQMPTAIGRCSDERYLHLFDGGNADNLGLRSVKRVLLQMAVEERLERYDAIVVVTLDAYTRPRGANPIDADPRGPIGMLVDLNVSDAVDSLLQANRARLLGEFHSGQLAWNTGDCVTESRQLPRQLCSALARGGRESIDLRNRMVFYHVGFADVTAFEAQDFEPKEMKRQLDAIPTSFMIDTQAAGLLERAAAHVLRPDNRCLLALRGLLRREQPLPQQVQDARGACKAIDRLDLPDGRGARTTLAPLRLAPSASLLSDALTP